MKQKQVERILEDRIDIPGIARDMLAVGYEPAKKRVVKPGVRFIDNKNGTITDTKTDLIWVKNPHTDLPEKFKEYMNWQPAIEACKELNFAGCKDWRLPTVEELRELVDYARGAKDNEPAIDTKFFPDTKCSWYWTNTPCAWCSGSAWYVYFSHGGVDYGGKGYSSYVRPVRSSQ
jgi:hypothetical protein